MKKELIKELINELVSSQSSTSEDVQLEDGIKIVVLQRGWVVIGRYHQEGEYGILTDAYVIRSWGTTKGLGELALEGKQAATKLDKTGTVRFHVLTTVAIIDCDQKIWKKEL